VLGSNKQGGHKDFYVVWATSERTHYIHGGCCIALSVIQARVALAQMGLVQNRRLPNPFKAQSRIVTCRPGAQQVILE
jgi:hypothetical protein